MVSSRLLRCASLRSRFAESLDTSIFQAAFIALGGALALSWTEPGSFAEFFALSLAASSGSGAVVVPPLTLPSPVSVGFQSFCGLRDTETVRLRGSCVLVPAVS